MYSNKSLWNYSLFAGLLRIILIVYGEWQDEHFVVKYTDIDYKVFTDAARHVANGESPYLRTTYRYTPLIAWILLPAITFNMLYGKLFFSLCDILVGRLIYAILSRTEVTDSKRILSVNMWLFNPIIFTVSTRGNAESVVSVLVLASIYFILQEHVVIAGLSLGLAVHFKLYPVIYSLPYLLLISNFNNYSIAANRKSFDIRSWFYRLYTLINMKTIKFISALCSTVIAANGLMYYLYGMQYIHEAYLYHFNRIDTRHNFSIYFYMFYLNTESWIGTIMSKLAFFPQAILIFIISIYCYTDIAFCIFVQTFVFVTFNKVCTSQYFLWYLSLLPLVLASNGLLRRHVYATMLAVTWFTSQMLWLFFAYLVEFKSVNAFQFVWFASILHFFANIFVLVQMINHHGLATVDNRDAIATKRD